ncbi:MAG TPA: helix-hairpin-helix domain-containing protein, partial [Smithellaceae bacterium]|nr:helix-hairpin-helix domain-containing protein [Smithellaceae bacterium]
MMTKEKIIEILEEIAVLLELSGENPFKSRAYSTAARNLEKVELDLADLVKDGKIFEIQGIGDAIGKKISELQSTGRLEYYEKLKASIPPGHLEMLKISGLGPRKIHALHQELDITTIGELEYACHENRLAELKGFGKKTQANILAGIERLKRYSQRRLYDEVWEEAQTLLAFVKSSKLVIAAEIAGSLRRGFETVKDMDILAATTHPEKVGEVFAAHGQVAIVIARGDTKVSVTLKSGVNADLRLVTPDEYPYALHHFTGSKEHNTAMRGRAKDFGLKMNEYGLFRGENNIVCRNEEEIFSALGLKFIEPELRENMGEIEAAEKGELPVLVKREDIRGIFHVHTNFSDGAESLENIIAAARQMGMEYVGISDHSQSAFYAGGLKIE